MEKKTIFELAAELGKTLKDDARIIALNAARDAFEADADVAALMTEYEVQQNAIHEEAMKEELAKEDEYPTRIEELKRKLELLDKKLGVKKK